MEESFFGFDTDMPSLGAGDGLGSTLGACPEDGEIDLMNDETFGAGAIGGDWEEEHEKVASSDFFGLQPDAKTHEDDLETSLSRLVVDDEEEENKGVPISGHFGRSHVTNIDDLFGPGSPPGLLHTDVLVSGQSNIWGSPRTKDGQVHLQQQQEEGLQSLLKQLQTTRAEQFQDPSIVMSGKTFSSGMQSAKTLNEVEQSIPGPPKVIQHVGSGDAPSRSRALTVEELEAQLHAAPPPAMPNTSIPPPPLPNAARGNMFMPPGSQAPSLEELEAAMRRGQPPPSMPNMSQPPPALGRPQSPTSLPLPIGTPPQSNQFMRQAGMQQRQASGAPINVPRGPGVSQPQGTPPVGMHGMGTPTESALHIGTPPQQVRRVSPPLGVTNANGPMVAILAPCLPPSSSSEFHKTTNTIPGPVSPLTILPTIPSSCPSPSPLLARNTPPPLTLIAMPDTTPLFSPATPNFPLAPPSTPQAIPVLVTRRHSIADAQPDSVTSAVDQRRHSVSNVLSSENSSQLPSATSRRHSTSHLQTSTPEASLIKAKVEPSLIKTKVTPTVARQFLQNLIGQGDVKSKDFNTTPKQRMPAPVPHSDPTHLANHRQGFHNQPANGSPSIRQSLFPNNGNQRGRGGPSPQRPYKDNHDGYDNGHYGYRDNRGYNRDGYGYDRDGFHNHRGDYRNNRGDYRNNRGDFHGGYRDNRGPDYRGDYRDNWGGDFRDSRGDFRGRRGGGYQSRPRHDSLGYDYEEEEENPNRDPYGGLMSKKEKDWIIKIQLMQLQTDNPYLDDYYYTAWQIKKIAAEQRKKQTVQSQSSTESEPKLVLPQLAGRIENRAYKPVQFENSLGRLTAASVHNPRHIIDVSVERPADKDEKSQEPRRYKELLLHIEMSYNILLDIDDIEKKALVLPEEARPPLLEERQTNINQLYQRVVHQTSQVKHFSKVVAVRKGVKLVARIIPLLQLNEATDLVCAVLKRLCAISKKEWQKDILPPMYNSMANVINMANLETLVRFADAARQGGADPATVMAEALQNAFGASVIWCLVNRGEQVYETEDPLDMDVEHQNAWREFVAVVAEVLSVLHKDQVAAPKGSIRAVRHHFERLIDKRTYISIEDKLQQLQQTRAS